jgi:hypothetical protein
MKFAWLHLLHLLQCQLAFVGFSAAMTAASILLTDAQSRPLTIRQYQQLSPPQITESTIKRIAYPFNILGLTETNWILTCTDDRNQRKQTLFIKPLFIKPLFTTAEDGLIKNRPALVETAASHFDKLLYHLCCSFLEHAAYHFRSATLVTLTVASDSSQKVWHWT